MKRLFILLFLFALSLFSSCSFNNIDSPEEKKDETQEESKDDICKEVSIDSQTVMACFPAGHICYDPHGIGDGVPTETDCWSGGGRLCHKGTEDWPTCAGGHFK